MDDYYSDNSFETKMNNYRDHNKQNGTTKNRMPNRDQYDNAQINEINHYKMRCEDLNKELVEKMSIISNLQDKIKSHENQIKNFKKSLQFLSDKNANQDTLAIELNAKSKKVEDLEEEIRNLQVEIINYQENIANKKNVIDEFQNLVGLSTNKFKIFEETNAEIIKENNNLKIKLDELNEHLNKEIHRNNILASENDKLKNILDNKESDLSKLKEEFKRLEDKYHRKIEDTEKSYKEKLNNNTQNIREDYVNNIAKLNSEVEALILETEKLKLDKSNLYIKLEEYDQVSKEKESEFKKILSFKDEEYDNLAKTIRALQMELRDLDSSYRSKCEEFKLQINQLQNDDEKKLIIINSKEKHISDCKNEVNRLNSTIEDLNSEINNLKNDIHNKDNINTKLNNDLNNFLNDLKLYEYKLRSNDETFEKSREEYDQKFRTLENEKDKLITDKKSLKDEVQMLRKRINDMEIFYMNKKKDIELETNDIIERNNQEIIKSYKLKEEDYIMEIKNLQNLLDERDRQKDDICFKLDNKIHKLQLKISELEARNNNLIRSLSSLKDMTLQIEKNFLNKIDFINSIRSNVRNNSMEVDDYKFLKIKENLKDMLNKLDYNLRSFSDTPNLNESYISNNYFRSKGNINESYMTYNRNERNEA